MNIFDHGWTYEIKVEKLVPNRPAPDCQDHDSPKFSDTGDDGSVEFKVLSVTPDEEDPNWDPLNLEDLTELVYQAAMEELRLE